MHSIVRGTGTPKDRASYILFEYIDPVEVGADISLVEVELWKPRNLFVCVSEEREDEERGEREGEDTQTLSLSSGTHGIHNSLAEHEGRMPGVELREPRNLIFNISCPSLFIFLFIFVFRRPFYFPSSVKFISANKKRRKPKKMSRSLPMPTLLAHTHTGSSVLATQPQAFCLHARRD